jgi:tetrahydromethanopterin S-methyltransferase subunit A
VASTAGKVKERRLERMRLGQAVCDIVPLPSDPEIRFAIVPLTEAEYMRVLSEISQLHLPDDLAGVTVKDRVRAQWTIVYAVREPDDLTKRVYDNLTEMLDDIDVGDLDELISRYNEMTEKASPSLEGIPESELEQVKKALQEMNWNDLSGSAWYALKRFLSTISLPLLLVNSPGSTSTNSSTTTNGEQESTPTVLPSSTE